MLDQEIREFFLTEYCTITEGVTEKYEVDRISALPDSLVQHILSFLPSTREAIRTGILSKRWKDQWTRVPVLILESSGMSAKEYLKFTENVLLTFESAKIKKFYIENDSLGRDPNFSVKIRFAIRRNVEDLILKCNDFDSYSVPDFVFKHASLVKLHAIGCTLLPKKTVNWESLCELSLSKCFFPNEAIESVLCGSPLLRWFELRFCSGFDQLAIFSNSLKRFSLQDYRNIVLRISCPNLKELSLLGGGLSHLSSSSHVIENVLSASLSLESLELSRLDGFDKLVIASESLRRLLLKEVKASAIDISCPNIKELRLEGIKDVQTIKLTN